MKRLDKPSSNRVSVNYRCRACHQGFSTSHTYDKFDGSAAEIKTAPHYCKDDVIVPGVVITVFRQKGLSDP